MRTKWKVLILAILISCGVAGCSGTTQPRAVVQKAMPPKTAVQDLYKPVIPEIHKSNNQDKNRTGSVSIPEADGTLNDFIPKGWKLLTKAEGDCNNDKLIDIAAVIEENKKWQFPIDGEAPRRILLVLFKQNNGNYKLVVNNPKVIFTADGGGVWGDPFDDGLSIDKGVLTIVLYGGSRERWGLTYKFRYQEKGWYLIGVTEDNLDTGTGEGTINDYNLITGEMIKTDTFFDQHKGQTLIHRGKRKLVNLNDFEPWETEF